LSELALYFHTVRHLRPVQIAARVWRRVHQPRPDLRPAPGRSAPVSRYVAPILARQTLIAPDTFRFLNVERRCATAADWSATDASKLWLYNLHYFADLNADDAPARALWHRGLLARWVSENPPGAAEGWEPYPVSLRIVNWVKWALRGNELPPACETSLAVQARWLCRRMEYQILGNHLLANAKALVHAGLYFSGIEADRWYRHGISIIDRQLHEQVLADGGHFELSTMYHALVLEDLLDLVNLLRAYGQQPPAHWHGAVAHMRRWLLLMSHPDGDIAFFNDAAFGIAPTPAELETYAHRLGLEPAPQRAPPLAVLAASGYVRLEAGPACLICDCAAVGLRYQPGHAHADTLSFELSLAGRRVFVNSGVSEYGERAERHRQRGTAAHNTVVVNGQDSSEVWGGFRVARRARARLCEATLAPPQAIVEGCHDGYARLPGRNRHTRRWSLDPRALRIEDRVSGAFQQAQARFHLHPDIGARLSGPAVVTLCAGAQELATVAFEGAAAVELGRGTWHPRFGVTVANSWIDAHFADASLLTHIRWSQAL
jgi:uncharacterized heparinase superfamily protein